MCVVCTNLSQNDYIESALAVKSTINGEAMTIPLASAVQNFHTIEQIQSCLLYTSPSPRDRTRSRMPSSA